MSDDPWKNRSSGMRCGTCMWNVTKAITVTGITQTAEVVEETYKKRLGRCRRHAPTMNGYPAVFENDWCGDHKLDENKIS